jgi:cytochrome c553
MRWSTSPALLKAVLAASVTLTTLNAQAPATLPSWAYPIPPAPSTTGAKPPASLPLDDQMHLPASTATYTRKQIADLFAVPDWYPDAHPQMPPVVLHGRKPDVYACAYCHLPTGSGRPENQSIAGLPAAYMLEQINDFKTGLRHSSEPRMGSVTHMIRTAKALTPEEAQEGVAYFAALKPQRWIRVVESDTVPKFRINGGMLVLSEAGGREPIGDRVIELPENLEKTELRDPTSGFVAYVPTGSLAKGEALVKSGGDGKTMPCVLCHGADLRGMGNTPSIAGRSPSQMTRQLIDFQTGARNGPGAAMMKMPVAKLTNTDIVDIVAYLASLAP